jgi:hypothetical protein
LARRPRRIDQALDRWTDKGLLSPEQAAELRAEAEVEHRAGTRRWGQLLVGILGAVALILAAGLFAERSWGSLSWAGRTAVLVSGGLGVWGLGWAVRRGSGWQVPGILLQAGGQGVVLVGLAYSANAWPSGTPAAWGVGLAALVTLAVLGPLGFHEGVLMSALQTALSLLYLALFLDRALDLDADTIVWCLDGVVAMAVAAQILLMGRWAEDQRDRALMALATSLWAGLVMVVITGFGPLDASTSGVLGMDLWLVLIAGLTLWGIHRAPTELRRDAYELNLALCVAVGGFLAMYTLGETFNLDSAGAGVGGVAVGALGMIYGLRHGATEALLAGSGVALFATWVFAIGEAGALGGVVALLVSAAVLFWLSTRLRAVDETLPGV